MSWFGEKDSRRSNKFARHKKRFATHRPRTRRDAMCGERRRSAAGADDDADCATRRNVAVETVGILERGHYTDQNGHRIDLSARVQHMRDGTTLYRPEDPISVPSLECRFDTIYEVQLESTLAAARRLMHEHKCERVVALNFASAKHPGGGFLNGAQAQEESLARASGLYASIGDASVVEMYEYNKKDPHNGLYSHHMIYTPDAPVFRDDDDEALLLGEHDVFNVSFITAPAVNARVAQRRNVDAHRIRAVMKERVARILRAAVHHGHSAIVLGAYGCGVFGNDLRIVGQLFLDALHSETFRGRFERVVFASINKSDVRVLQNIIDWF